MARQFTEAETQEIFKRIVERDQKRRDGLLREDLRAAAAELGMDPEAVDSAILEMDREREIEAELQSLRDKRRSAFLSNLSSWASVNAGLFGIDYLTGGGWWFYWPLLTWGTVVLLQGQRMILRNSKRDRETVLKRLQKRAQAEERKQRKQRRQSASKQFEAVIEDGVSALLSALAKEFSDLSEPRRASKGPGGHKSSDRFRVEPTTSAKENAWSDRSHSEESTRTSRTER